jgi:hypothetical protein
MTVDSRRWLPASCGIAGIAAAIVAADTWASRTGRPTLSAAVAHLGRDPLGGPIVIGVLAALAWHLVADPTIRRLET